MKIIRKFLYKTLGLKIYLLIISKTYICLIKLGFFKKHYAELHYIKKLVKPGFVCIDIGANLGYYSYFLCKTVGNAGKIYAVEPVELFRKILHSNVNKRFKNSFEILPYAFGSENKEITMGMPVLNGIIHHGMTHIISEKESQNIEKTFQVEMKIPDEVFSHLEQLNYIKCDVEGYEFWVFSNMKKIISRFMPIVQCELGSQYKAETMQLFKDMNYETYILKNFKLEKQTDDFILQYKNDVYFIPSNNTKTNQ